MAERSSPATENTQDQIFELIPWYVNGSLSDAEAKMVETYADSDPKCRAEIDRQSEIAAGVCMLEPLEADAAAQARSWDQLSAAIASEQKARSPARQRAAWFPSFRGMTALAGTLAAVVMVAVIFTGPTDPTNQDFRTFTSGDGGDAQVIMFQLAPGTDDNALATVLADHGLTLLGEPTETGVYRASVSTEALPQDTAEALMSTPEILFAAPEGQE